MGMSSLNDGLFDVNSCVYYKHTFSIPIGLDINAITRFNNKVNALHLENMKVWSNTPTTKGVKPRPTKAISQHLACLCYKLNEWIGATDQDAANAKQHVPMLSSNRVLSGRSWMLTLYENVKFASVTAALSTIGTKQKNSTVEED